MRRLEAIGITQLDEAPPAIDAEVGEALCVWRFMGGWRPELLPAFASIYGLADAELTIELLHTLREEREKR